MTLPADRAVEPPPTWRCFHCGLVLTDEQRAKEHFGPTRQDIPECQVAAHPFALELQRQLSIASSRLRAARDVIADLVDICYAEGSSSAWKVCQLCDMEHRPDDARPGDQTHQKGCIVDEAERWLRQWQREHSVSLTAPPSQRFVAGYDAQFWHDSYHLLRDAIVQQLDDCIRDDDVAEEAILVEAIETAGKRLAEKKASVPGRDALIRSLRRIAQQRTISSLDAPTIDDAADLLELHTAPAARVTPAGSPAGRK